MADNDKPKHIAIIGGSGGSLSYLAALLARQEHLDPSEPREDDEEPPASQHKD